MDRALTRVPQLLALLLALVLLCSFGRQYVFSVIEREAFVTRPAGTLTPDLLGAPSQQITFRSGKRTLHASYVPAADDTAPAVLIFHGDEESIAQWAAVQKHLHDEGIASLVFDYSGYGASSGSPSIRNLREDGLAAYRRFVLLTPKSARRYVLGFSLGTAALLDVVDRLKPPPTGIVLASGFASAREAAIATGRVSEWIAWLLPDIWNNEERVRLLDMPVLIVHSRADEVVPFQHAERLCRAASGARSLILLDDLAHDAAITPEEAERFWPPIVRYLQSGRIESDVREATSEHCP